MSIGAASRSASSDRGGADSAGERPAPVQVGGCQYVPKFVNNRWCLVPDTHPDALEFTFVPKVDQRTGRTFFVNLQTRNRSWDLVDVSALAPMPPLPQTQQRDNTMFALCVSADGENVYAPKNLSIPLLPEHCWVPRADRVHQRYFFLNAKTNEKVMLLPATVDNMRRVEAFYAKYDLEARGEPPVQRALTDWAGREQQLLADLVLRFGPEPPSEKHANEVAGAYFAVLDRQQIPHPSLLELSELYDTPEKLLAFLKAEYGAPPLTLRQRILLMYHHYAPQKLHQADDVVSQYAGKLESLLQMLVSKWGPEPPTTTDTFESGAATLPSVHELRKRVLASVRKYAPQELNRVDELLALNKGREHDLLEALAHRFGPEPSAEAELLPTRDISSNHSGSGMISPRSLSNYEDGRSSAGDQAEVFRARLVAFYRRYNPGKMATVDDTLRKYAGQEEFLMQQLVRKYGPEPQQPNSGGSVATPANVSFNTALADGAPAAVPDTRTLEERARAMLEVYCREQLNHFDVMLQQYDGAAGSLLEALIGAYGNEPTVEELSAVRSHVAEEEAAAAAAAAETSLKGARKRGHSLVDQTRARVSAIFREHAPEMITSVDHLLAQYAGREEDLLRELAEQYETPASVCVAGETAAASSRPAAHDDSLNDISPEQIRKRISDKAQAESLAFLRALDEKIPIIPATMSTPSSSSNATTAEECPLVHQPSSSVGVDEVISGDSSPFGSFSTQQGGAPAVPITTVRVTPSSLLTSENPASQLSALERRLREALDATERILMRNEYLHQENNRLTNTLRDLERNCQLEVREMEDKMSAMEQESRRMHHEFALERIRLKMEEESVQLKMKQESQDERAKYVEEHLKTAAERKQLEQLLLDNRQAVSSCEDHIRTLEIKIKHRERELDDARAEIKFLTIQLDGDNLVDSSTQTESHQTHSEDNKHNYSTRQLRALDLTRIASMQHGGATDEVATWRHRAEALERELEAITAQHRQAQEECENAAKFIIVLQNKKRRLEEAVSKLQLRELALPSSPPCKTDVDYRRLEEDVLSLQSQLRTADEENRQSRRQIAELRSLLSIHMAGRTPRRTGNSK